MSNVKLLSLDLDGTLLRDDKTVSKYTTEVLRRCGERGIIAAVNTGRGACVCERVLPFIPHDVLVTSGGAIAVFGGEVLYKALLPEKTVNELVRRSVANPDVSDILVDMPGCHLAERPLEMTDPLYIDYRDKMKIADLTKEITGEVYRIGMQCHKPKALEKIVDGIYGVCAVEPETALWREIQSVHAGKWQAILAVAKRFSINAEEIAAIGDEWNDYDSIKNAGYGIAMGNAVGGVKDAAREVCGTNNEDGAARWIEENVLK